MGRRSEYAGCRLFGLDAELLDGGGGGYSVGGGCSAMRVSTPIAVCAAPAPVSAAAVVGEVGVAAAADWWLGPVAMTMAGPGTVIPRLAGAKPWHLLLNKERND